MADETQITEQEVETTTEGKGETPAEKMFSQKEVDQIVQTRLAKEKLTLKRERETFDAEKAGITSSLELYESKLKELIAPQLETIPDEYKELVEKLPLLEQVEWLNKKSKSVSTDKRFIGKTAQSTETVTKQKSIGTII